MKSNCILKSLSVAALSLLLFGIPAIAQHGNPNPKKIKKLIHLTAGPAAPNANGIAKAFMKTKGNAMQRFQVVGANLTAGMSYTLVVDGNIIETKQAAAEQGGSAQPGDTGGAVEFLYVKQEHGQPGDGEPLPAVLDPVTNIVHVEIDDGSGMVVLSGDFPPS